MAEIRVKKFSIGDYIKRPNGKIVYEVKSNNKFVYDLYNMKTDKYYAIYTDEADKSFILVSSRKDRKLAQEVKAWLA